MEPFKFIELSDDQKALIKVINMQAACLYGHFKACEYTSREMSFALSHLEECIMWATKAIGRMK